MSMVEEVTKLNGIMAWINKQFFSRALFDHDPIKMIFKLSRYCLSNTDDEKEARLGFRKVNSALDMDFMFGGVSDYVDVVGDWEDYFIYIFKKLRDNRKMPKTSVLDFICDQMVRENIDVQDMRVPSKNQKLACSEVAFVLQDICRAIMRSVRTKGVSHALLSNNWFLHEKNAKRYKTKTKRSINAHKMARITDLLHQAGLIEKKQRKGQDGKTMRNIYRLGAKNFYLNRLGMKED